MMLYVHSSIKDLISQERWMDLAARLFHRGIQLPYYKINLEEALYFAELTDMLMEKMVYSR